MSCEACCEQVEGDGYTIVVPCPRYPEDSGGERCSIRQNKSGSVRRCG